MTTKIASTYNSKCKEPPMALFHSNKNYASDTGGAYTQLSDNDFRKFSAYIYDACGIKLPPIKKTMLSARLQKRLRHLKMNSCSTYLEYVLSPQGQAQELHHLIDVVSTNKTDFFREAQHFEALTSVVLPEYFSRLRHSTRPLRVWSAGCSSGEEPYTIAMVLDDFFRKYPGRTFSILATDICTQVLDKAREAIYTNEDIQPVPPPFKHRYLMRGKGNRKGSYRVVPELRSMVNFQRLNFMDQEFHIREKIDIIFCRNVIIYFDRPTQEKVLNRLCRYLNPGGFLFMGHSETLNGLRVPLVQAAPTIYRRT